jgi:hypothetical protein
VCVHALLCFAHRSRRGGRREGEEEGGGGRRGGGGGGGRDTTDGLSFRQSNDQSDRDLWQPTGPQMAPSGIQTGAQGALELGDPDP